MVAAALSPSVAFADVPADKAAEEPPTALLDHLLRSYVDDNGFVDYASLRSERKSLDRYVDALGHADLEAMPDAERLATLINAYNAFMLQMVLDAGDVRNVLEDLDEPFEAERFMLAGRRVSLNGLENDWIRAKFDEPRIHWAVNCAATSCPPLRAEAYVADRLDEQLEDQEQRVHNDPRFARLDGNTLHVTPLYDWYGEDFIEAAGSVIDYVRPHVPELAKRPDDFKPEVVFLEYDWTLNDIKLQKP